MTDCYLQFLLGFILACILAWVVFGKKWNETGEENTRLAEENELLELELDLLKQELGEENLSTAQIVLIDRIISKMSIKRMIKDFGPV